jgi:hypothetical protein
MALGDGNGSQRVDGSKKVLFLYDDADRMQELTELSVPPVAPPTESFKNKYKITAQPWPARKNGASGWFQPALRESDAARPTLGCAQAEGWTSGPGASS